VSESPRVGDKDRYPPSRVVPGNRWRCFTQAMSGWMAYSRDPILAEEHVARAMTEKVDHDHVVEYPYQGSVATTNGESVWAFRYSSEGKSRSLYFSTSVVTLRQPHPQMEILHGLSEETRWWFLIHWRLARSLERSLRVRGWCDPPWHG
jgi:hypothetical protein